MDRICLCDAIAIAVAVGGRGSGSDSGCGSFAAVGGRVGVRADVGDLWALVQRCGGWMTRLDFLSQFKFQMCSAVAASGWIEEYNV